MKKLLSILLLFVTFGALAQTYDTLPTGSKPYGNFYLGPDGNLVFGNAGLKFRVIGTKKRVDSLLALKANTADIVLKNNGEGNNTTLNTPTIVNGTINNAQIGNASPSTARVTDLTTTNNTSFSPGGTIRWEKPGLYGKLLGVDGSGYFGAIDISGSYQLRSEKGQANGYASLDGSGKVPLTQINDALLGAVNYRGTYNAATNFPTLPAAASSNKGYYYIVSTAGTQFGLEFRVGDWIISNGSSYGKVSSSSDVESVNGKKGVVNVNLNDVLTAGNVSEQAASFGAVIAGSASVTSAPTQPSHVVRLDDISTGKTIGANAASADKWNNVKGNLSVSVSGLSNNIGGIIAYDRANNEYRYAEAPILRGYLGIPTSGETLQSVTDRSNSTSNYLFTYDSPNDKGVVLDSYGVQATNAGNFSPKNLALQRFGGNVGIGTTTPTEKLTVIGSMGATNIFAHSGNQTPDAYYSNQKFSSGVEVNKLSLYNFGGATYGIGISGATGFTNFSGDNGHAWYTGTSDLTGANANLRMRLTVDGKLGLGNANPTELLDVNGKIKSTHLITRKNNNDSSPIAAFGILTDGYSLLLSRNGESGRYEFTPETQQGFTFNSGVNGSVFNGSIIANGDIEVQNNAFWTRNSTSDLGTRFDANTLQSANFNNSATKPFIINPSGGNVGVGTTTPGSTLEVNGTIRASSNDGSSTAVARNVDLQGKANLSGGNSFTGNGVQNFIGTGDQRSTIQPGIFSVTNTASTAYSALGLYDVTVSAGTNQTSYKNGFINSNVTGTALSFDLPTVSGRLLTGIKTVVTLDFPNTAANQNSTLQRTVANVAVNDVVTIGLPNSLMSTMTSWNGDFQVWVSAANTLSFRFQNNDPAASHDLPDTTFTIFIHKQ